MIELKHIPGFFITLFTVLILLFLCNSFFSYLGYNNDQAVSEMEAKEVLFIIGSVAMFSGTSAGLSVLLVRLFSKVFDTLKKGNSK